MKTTNIKYVHAKNVVREVQFYDIDENWSQIFFYFSQAKIPRNKFVLNMIGNQNNNAFKDWVIVTTDFLFFNTRWVNT